MTRKTLLKGIQLVIAYVLFAVFAGSALAGDTTTPPIDSLLRDKILWTMSDITRLVEEIRRLEDPWAKRLLIEEVENILYKEIEFPFYIHTIGQETANAVNVASGQNHETSNLSELFAKTYALAGIARAYEGNAIAAEDYIDKAKKVFPDIQTLTLKIDSFQNPRTVQEWIEEANLALGESPYVKVTFHSKMGTPSVTVLEKLQPETVKFSTDRMEMEYPLYVAESDFLKGIQGKISSIVPTDIFSIYLPAGKYQLLVNLQEVYTSTIQVYPDPTRNHLLIEGIKEGITVYPSPAFQGLTQ
ncbi:MAG: hypothetical protein KKE17_15505 [Proteobacteria bacterium]|nr:hypothetical protein [Pseudomonadota bacterium]MBU1711404.1 hypothetical protein [Pseudomonadota bacterium]